MRELGLPAITMLHSVKFLGRNAGLHSRMRFRGQRAIRDFR